MTVQDAPATRAYVDRTVRTWLGLGADADVPRLPETLERRLLRIEERERPYRDQYGCWEAPFSESFREAAPWTPEIDVWLEEQRRELEPRVGLEPRWPGGHRFAACFTHDVDLVSRASTPRQAFRSARAGWAGDERQRSPLPLRLARPPARLARSLALGVSRAPSTATTLERSVAVERERGIVGSYFFTVRPAGGASPYDCVYAPGDPCLFRGERRSIAEVARVLADEGFDVGLHGSYHAATRDGALRTEREALASATGLPITTTRQHFLRWDAQTTPRRQDAAGLRTDSSLGFNRSIGFRGGTSLPFRWLDLEGARVLDLLELPLVVQDGALLASYGLELDLELARDAVRRIVAEIARTGGVATFLFHPNNLDQPAHAALYEWTVEHVLEQGAWTASVAGIDAWWREREGRLGAA